MEIKIQNVPKSVMGEAGKLLKNAMEGLVIVESGVENDGIDD